MTVVFQSILPFLAIIVVLIVIHELGHYITAKIFGVKVLEAGIGYPPRIWGFKRGDTEYTINAIP
ncbi:MAG: site-2 protease family protein, partial [Chloroflexi bacterium]|nr:site-2 protease family protein [Chloroflexota bacterium]